MAANSSIQWTDHTFNPIWGCVKVSPGCVSCYAETWANRYGFKVWGPAKTTGRRTFGPKHWAEPLKWNKDAQKAGERKRVFCASMADVFEDHPVWELERPKLWELIEQTQHLDWLLLTKRPENIRDMAPGWWVRDGWPDNIWLGTSVENQEYADKRIPELLKVPARVRFLSCEPLLGPIDLQLSNYHRSVDGVEFHGSFRTGINWVIVGGESGHGARPMHPDWARSLQVQCERAGVSFFFKQWGCWLHRDVIREQQPGWYSVHYGQNGGAAEYVHFDKHAAGRLLDGRTWDEVPA